MFTSRSKATVCCPNYTELCTNVHLNEGHLSIQDNQLGPSGVCYREVLMYSSVVNGACKCANAVHWVLFILLLSPFPLVPIPICHCPRFHLSPSPFPFVPIPIPIVFQSPFVHIPIPIVFTSPFL